MKTLTIDEHAHGDDGYDHPGGLYPPGKWPPELPSRKEVAASIADEKMTIVCMKEAE